MMLRPRLGTAPCPDLRTDGFTGRDGPQVMDYMVSDLEMVIKDKACRLNPADIKAYMHMTLQAVAHCHQVRVNIPCASSEELRAPTCAAPLARLHMRALTGLLHKINCVGRTLAAHCMENTKRD